MDHHCLVLSGRLLDGQDPATVNARLAAAFGMEPDGFRERVFERAPLIIRRGLDAATAGAQAAQLRGMGAEAEVLADSDRLIWLRRDQVIRGPLPADALDRFAEPGDQWCHDGGQTWFAWQPGGETFAPPPWEPPAEEHHETPSGTEPTPAHDDTRTRAEPPPLPSSPSAAAAAAKRPIAAGAVIAAVAGLLALAFHALAPLAVLLALGTLVYLYRRPLLRGRAWAATGLLLSACAFALWMMRPAPVPVAQPYVPRPLQPLASDEPVSSSASPAQCVARAAAPKNEEDRFLVTGQRMLTGRAQRKGDTYVAEAVVSVDRQCQPSALQLYVFRNGVFIGTALDTATSLAHAKLADFDLIDDQHLRITLAQCTDKPGDCAATTVKQIAVMPGGGGWTLGEIK